MTDNSTTNNSTQFPSATKINSAQLTVLTWLRAIGIAEGISFLLLLFIATPLKHFGENPMPVKVLGPIHGGLFLLYILAAIIAAKVLRWPWTRVPLAFMASVVPFGPFLFEAWLRRQIADQL